MKIEYKDILTKVVLVEKAPFLVNYERSGDIAMLVRMCVSEDEFYKSCKEFKLDYTFSLGFEPLTYYIITRKDYDLLHCGMLIRKRNCIRI